MWRWMCSYAVGLKIGLRVWVGFRHERGAGGCSCEGAGMRRIWSAAVGST